MRKLLMGLFSVLFFVSSFLIIEPVLAGASKPGIVIMHGKGGSPSRLVQGLADELADRGFLVANIEMPWSGDRQYDVDTDTAAVEVDKAIAGLKARGAKKVFVAGHSQGGAFATYYAATHRVDGMIAIVPGGDPDSDLFSSKLYRWVKKARKLVAAGKGDEKIELKDFEGRKGLFTVNTTPRIYLTWFEPKGAMNYPAQARKISADTPVLWIESTNDLPTLRRVNLDVYKKIPKHPKTQLAEPGANHKGAPGASVDIIADWTSEVAAAK